LSDTVLAPRKMLDEMKRPLATLKQILWSDCTSVRLVTNACLVLLLNLSSNSFLEARRGHVNP